MFVTNKCVTNKCVICATKFKEYDHPFDGRVGKRGHRTGTRKRQRSFKTNEKT